MRARLETHVVPSLTGSQLSLRQRLSEGAFGTVYVADVRGIPDYGVRTIGGGGGSSSSRSNTTTTTASSDDDEDKKLVAVKFLSDSASEQER